MNNRIGNSIFSSMALATSVIAAIGTIRDVVSDPSVVTVEELDMAVSPVIGSVQMLLPKVKVPRDLTLAILAAVAGVINNYFKKFTAAEVKA